MNSTRTSAVAPPSTPTVTQCQPFHSKWATSTASGASGLSDEPFPCRAHLRSGAVLTSNINDTPPLDVATLATSPDNSQSPSPSPEVSVRATMPTTSMAVVPPLTPATYRTLQRQTMLTTSPACRLSVDLPLTTSLLPELRPLEPDQAIMTYLPYQLAHRPCRVRYEGAVRTGMPSIKSRQYPAVCSLCIRLPFVQKLFCSVSTSNSAHDPLRPSSPMLSSSWLFVKLLAPHATLGRMHIPK
ncbi:hypothetical protein EDD17DRAFT_1192314 [Pisolithus thermaeus]|nr:hypothetical protein EV401DRAFT_1250319 [Pisolithus croceorrhizus]KAI6150054.1 hypothetical protein EDD17DRAFT_1192314 [Pisolithus thermaeus]